MRNIFTISCTIFFCTAYSQDDDSTTNILNPIIIRAFEQNRRLKDVPAAINYINTQQLKRFGGTSLVNAVNTTAGVRLEERSPGSYRLNIRGSSLRSPFGVRNVKVYYNDLPITDPGGNTYFNNLGFYNVSSMEIVKGPGSSLYGAGTGGTVLMEALGANESTGLFSEYTAGSYGLQNIYVSAALGNDEEKNKIAFQHQQSDGYRNHSTLQRNILSWNGQFKPSAKSFLKTTFLYSHLYYETPGALTQAEYLVNPKAARPAAGGFPGAETARASIQQKTFLAGLYYAHAISEAFSTAASAYGMFTELRNPAVRNYGENKEPHVGGRASITYKNQNAINHFQVTAGAELQEGFFTVAVSRNKNGNADSLQTLDDIRLRQSFVFLQASFEAKGWTITAGSSLNFFRFAFRRSVPFPLPEQKRNFSNEVAPRISLSKSWKALTVYSSVSEGFSPPTAAELLPSGSAINLSLNAEKGLNYELGTRGSLGRFNFDINVFSFALKNTIVQRRDAGGGDFFINAGSTAQRGVETMMSYPFLKPSTFLKQSNWWLNHTYHHFRYKEFKQLATDFSGKALPGIAPHTLSTGIDLSAKNGLLANANLFYSAEIPLNDANSESANNYWLVNLKVGYEKNFNPKWQLRISAGVENLLNEKYSLGNDINAFGGRFYNAAPRRNYYVSISNKIF